MMKRVQRIAILFLLGLVTRLPLGAQTVEISPLPQQISWGEVAFPNDIPLQLVGTRQADTDALRLLHTSSLRLTDRADVKLCIGQAGDQAIAPYRTLIPRTAEGYYLQIEPNRIVVAGRDAAGTYYGVQTLLQIFSQRLVMQCRISDWPSVACRGVIEGFYGNPWSHENRLRQFEFYGRNKMNTYVFGPKDDPYHRAKWREPYPANEAAQISSLVETAHRNKVKFVWALHPGGDIRWNRSDSLAVVNKLEAMYSLGVRAFALFFDDIRGEGTRADKQAGLLNYVSDHFVRRHKDVEPLILCPTQYNKAWAKGNYLTTLGEQLYPEIRIMWTGDRVVDMIERDDMEWINAQIKRKAFIWLNYPVNDYCPSRLLMGKTYGNGLDINQLVSGLCSNPMEYAEASKVSLYSIADYTWNMAAYRAEESWRRAMQSLMPTSAEAFALFCENNIDLGKTNHRLRREGESATFRQSDPRTYLEQMSLQADRLLADSINQPEMLAEIAPWVRSMKLLAERGMQALRMESALQRGDSAAFVAAYRAQQAAAQAQQGIVSRNYPGSIVKAKPLVSGDVITPWVTHKVDSLTQAAPFRLPSALH